jgi:serine/threonine-protein kinase
MREVSVGDKLDQYELTELLAKSGMASIFKAVDTLDGNKTVALKIPHPQYESDVVFFERFRREEELGQRLDHPNIVKVRKPRHQSQTYVVMELIEGTSLRALLDKQRHHPLPTAEALSIARQVAEALVYLHAQGVVHRDIKPENILITPSGQIKILDFGIALDESARRITWAGLSSTIGTPDYMAPEQIGGRRGDARTDIYALGTLLYEMLTGHLPFTGPNAHSLMRAKTDDQPKPPSYWVPAIDPKLETIVLRAIERAPRDRYESATDLLADLRDPAAVVPRDPLTGAARQRRRFHLPRRLVMPLVVAAILCALASLVWLSSRRPEPPHAPDTPPPAGTPRQR